jgi:hypothetical protein
VAVTPDAATLLARLRAAGVSLERHGDRIRYVPAERVSPSDREALRVHKAEVLRLLEDAADPSERPAFAAADGAELRTRYRDDLTPGERQRLHAEAASGDPLAAAIVAAVACAPEACAWRLYSPRLGRELWVVRDLEALRALEHDGLEGLPAVHGDDLERFRTLDDQRLADVLDALAVFPGARIADLAHDAEHAT